MNRYLAVLLAAWLWVGCTESDDLAGPDTGEFAIVVTTTGTTLDPNGYLLSINDAPSVAVASNATIRQAGFTPGAYTIRLSGLAVNCVLTGENPRTVTIVAGAEASVTFTVDCPTPVPATGAIEVTTTTSGADLDADGYSVVVDGGLSVAIGQHATLTFPELTPGTHSVQLLGSTPNCQVQGPNPRSADVTAGQTTTVAFDVSCVGISPNNHSSVLDGYWLPTFARGGALKVFFRSIPS